MSFTPWSTVVVGQVATAAWANSQIGDNLSYLHGDAGPIEFADAVKVAPAGVEYVRLGDVGATNQTCQAIKVRHGVSGVLYPAIGSDGAGNLLVGDVVTPDGFAGVRLYSAGANGVAANGMRVHRHPYSSDRHIEILGWSLGAGATSSGTFTDPFGSAPLCFGQVQNSSSFAGVSVFGVTSTGASVKNNGGSTLTVGLHADGAD